MANYKDPRVSVNGIAAGELPAHMHASLVEYIERGSKVGHFLTAVLNNDLKEAVGRADHINITLIPLYVCWLYNQAPQPCWGSAARVEQWMASGGLQVPRPEPQLVEGDRNV